MSSILPPTPIGVPPGHSFWNDWYEKLRTLINSGTIASSWATLDFTGSNITSILNRAHNNLQSFDGGTANEYYHLTAAQHAKVSVATSGVYTPTLSNTTNVAASTSYPAQYMRIGDVVTVSGRVDVDPTAAAATALGISLPIASNFGALEDCAGTAASDAVAGQSAAIRANIANDRAEMAWVAVDIANRTMYYTFTYRII